jgi:uncharacterized protein
LTDAPDVVTLLSLREVALQWTWDPNKDRRNRRVHKLGFELASRVFDDPHHASRPDPSPDEERWRTIGMIGHVAVLVIHTSPDVDPKTGKEIGRIISARKATPHERKAYEDGAF